MNKKGFTLVELVVTIAILVTVTLVAVPSIANMTNRNKQKQKDRIEQLILDAKDTYFSFNESESTVTVSKLINEKLIDENSISDIVNSTCSIGKSATQINNTCFK